MIYMFKVIHYCLHIYLKTLEINVLKYMNLILLILLSAPGLARQACLKNKEIKLESLTKIDIFSMVEKGTRSGICHTIHRYLKENNKYMKEKYNKNKE